MNADANIQVWLETSAVAQTSIISPHVQSDAAKLLTYRITTTQESRAGRSSIGQSGEVALEADQPTALSRLAVRREADDRCRITLILLSSDMPERHYDFACPDTLDEPQPSR